MTREEALAQNANAIALFNASAPSIALDNLDLVTGTYAIVLGLAEEFGNFSNADARIDYWLDRLNSDLSADDFIAEFLFLAENDQGNLTAEEFGYNTGAVPVVANNGNAQVAALEAQGRSIADLTPEEAGQALGAAVAEVQAAGQAAAEAARQEAEEGTPGDDAGQDGDAGQDSGDQDTGGSDDAPAPGLPNVPPVTPTYTLEQALDRDTLPARYNIDESAIATATYKNLEAAEKGATAAYDILKGARNLPADGSVEGDVDLLNKKFVDLFQYSVALDSVKVGNVSFNEGLTLFFAHKILAGKDEKELKDLTYTVKDSVGELRDITVGLVPKEEELYANAEAIVIKGAVTAEEFNALNKIAEDINNSLEITEKNNIADKIVVDISSLKGEEYTLDFSEADLVSNITIKVAELNDQGNKGDLESSDQGSRKSDQLIKLPELSKLTGELTIENMTVASVPQYKGENTQIDNKHAVIFGGVSEVNTDDIITFFKDGDRVDVAVTSDKSEDGIVTFTPHNGAADDVQIKIYNGVLTVVASKTPDDNGVKVSNGTFNDRDADLLTNDVLDFSASGIENAEALAQAIASISINTNEVNSVNYVSITIGLTGGGEIQLENVFSKSVFVTAMREAQSDAEWSNVTDLQTAKTAAQEAGNQVDLIKLIGQAGTFVYDEAMV